MTEKTFNRLAAEARKRHKDDPAFFGRKKSYRDPSDAFWYWWGEKFRKEAAAPPQNYLIFSGILRKEGGVYRQRR